MAADTSCFSCDPVIPPQTPSVVYSEMPSVFTFTSCPFLTLLYVLYILYSFTMRQHSAEEGHWQGYLPRSLLAVRKWTLIGLVTIRSPRARATEAPAKASFFKWERGLFNSCISSQAGRQWRGKRDKRKQMQNREDFLNGNLRIGLLLKRS